MFLHQIILLLQKESAHFAAYDKPASSESGVQLDYCFHISCVPKFLRRVFCLLKVCNSEFCGPLWEVTVR